MLRCREVALRLVGEEWETTGWRRYWLSRFVWQCAGIADATGNNCGNRGAPFERSDL